MYKMLSASFLFGALLNCCVHSHLYKSFDKSFFLEQNNLAPGKTMFRHSVQNIHRNAAVVTLNRHLRKATLKVFELHFMFFVL